MKFQRSLSKSQQEKFIYTVISTRSNIHSSEDQETLLNMRESVIYAKIKGSKLPKDSKLFTGKGERVFYLRGP